MNIKNIENEENRRAVLAEIERLRDAPPGSPDGQRRDALLELVAQYETRGRSGYHRDE